MINIYALLKFGKEPHVLDLYNNGTLFMNSVQYYRKVEDNYLRGDKYEGASRIVNFPKGKLLVPSINYEGSYQSLHLIGAFEEVFGNIFSMYCISSNGWKKPEDFFIDQKVKEFGTHCLFIKRTDIFLSKIEAELKKQKQIFKHGFISYYNKQQINRETHLFEKPSEFDYQKEFRIYVQRESTEPFIINIGSLENISEIMETKTVVDGLRIQREDYFL